MVAMANAERVRMRTISALFLGLFFLPSLLLAAQEERFATSEEAVKALTEAAFAKDTNALNAIFGPGLRSLISADPIQASNGLAVFSQRMSQRVSTVAVSDSKIELNIGYEAWPFPIPLVKDGGQWGFDTAAGQEEILNRRVGRNELDTIRVCGAYVDAQRQYASIDRMGDGVIQYAQHLRSTPGKHDGLYWHAEPDEDISPLGPLIAAARGEGYSHKSKIMGDAQNPYHGYFFKVLTRQGSQAPGGKYNYIINGHMVAGFALVAWPAEWGNSGVMTFMVNQEGKILESDLGPGTSSIALKMKEYNPDANWKAVGE
jgi:hypothetical protein